MSRVDSPVGCDVGVRDDVRRTLPTIARLNGVQLPEDLTSLLLERRLLDRGQVRPGDVQADAWEPFLDQNLAAVDLRLV